VECDTTYRVDSNTLAERLHFGRLPVWEALSLARMLAESLRRLHDSGAFHGCITPEVVRLGESEIVLEEGKRVITTYTAPEVIAGRQPDARADIFAFGAIVFEMFTGRSPMEDESRGRTTSSGSPAVDRLVLPCLASNPAERTPRMQRVLFELKILTMAARRAARKPAAKPEQADGSAERIQEFVERSIERLSERIATLERAVEGLKAHSREFEHSVAIDLSEVEQNFKVHTAAMDAVRTAMSQTDELVVRVVEALETLQSAVLEPGDPRRKKFAVN
jgi:eukaryotic-like serine/threonine-protein kinase